MVIIQRNGVIDTTVKAEGAMSFKQISDHLKIKYPTVIDICRRYIKKNGVMDYDRKFKKCGSKKKLTQFQENWICSP